MGENWKYWADSTDNHNNSCHGLAWGPMPLSTPVSGQASRMTVLGPEQLLGWGTEAGQATRRPRQPLSAPVTSEIHMVRVLSEEAREGAVGKMVLAHMICVPRKKTLLQASMG